MFILIALGMGCGLGEYPLVLTVTAILIAFLWVLDYSDGARRPKVARVGIRVDEPRAALQTIRAAFPSARVLEAPDAKFADRASNLILMELDGTLHDQDAAGILDALKAKAIPGVRAVVMADDAPQRIRN